jgi:glucan 1,3-beta-glucosidase
MWDSHIRLGGAKGTNTDVKTCPSGTKDVKCTAAYLSMHLTATSSAYLEGTWVWAADHDMEDTAQGQTSVFAGRGILSESAGPMWFIGTASEHHALYQYSLGMWLRSVAPSECLPFHAVGAKNHYMGSIQTETPYYQPDPAPPTPFTVDAAFKDPVSSEKSAWGLWVEKSQSIFVLGAGHYSVRKMLFCSGYFRADTCSFAVLPEL